jgi:hypothetical protein
MTIISSKDLKKTFAIKKAVNRNEFSIEEISAIISQKNQEQNSQEDILFHSFDSYVDYLSSLQSLQVQSQPQPTPAGGAQNPPEVPGYFTAELKEILDKYNGCGFDQLVVSFLSQSAMDGGQIPNSICDFIQEIKQANYDASLDSLHRFLHCFN